MTVWSGAQVAGFAREAGWRGEELTVAVAMALAGSGGDDAADTGGNFDGRPLWRGLWLVPLGELSSITDGDLFHPTINAAAAYYLWADQGSWVWNPAWGSGAWRWQLDAAGAYVAAGIEAGIVKGPVLGSVDLQGAIRRLADTAGTLAHRFAGAATRLRS